MAWIWYPLEPLGNRKGFHGFHPRLLHKCGTPGTRAETPRVPLMKDVNPLINKALRKVEPVEPLIIASRRIFPGWPRPSGQKDTATRNGLRPSPTRNGSATLHERPRNERPRKAPQPPAVRIVRVPPCRARLHAMRWILPVGARPWWIMLAPCLMPRLPLPQLGSPPNLVPLADLHPRTRPTDEPPFSICLPR